MEIPKGVRSELDAARTLGRPGDRITEHTSRIPPLPPSAHPTRRADGRTPNPRTADTALAAALNAPVEALELLMDGVPVTPLNGEVSREANG